MLNLIQKYAWQGAAGLAAIALVISAGFLVSAQLENRRVTELNRVLDDRITNPNTGYVVKLAQAQTNAETTKVALEAQVGRLKAKADVDAARLAEAERRLAVAQRESAAARREVAAFLARPPQGDTLEQRVQDVDTRFLEMLK